MTTEKRIALVTGATRGIGQAIALTLAQKGLYVPPRVNQGLILLQHHLLS